MKSKEKLSVAHDIKALALINIQDIFRFTITAKDDEINYRYGSEKIAVEVAEKYLDIALKAQMLEYDLQGWSMKYSVPMKDSDERIEKTAQFFDTTADRKTEPTGYNLSPVEGEPTISKMEQVDKDINVRSKESE